MLDPVSCPSCGAQYLLREAEPGDLTMCSRCATSFVVPDPAESRGDQAAVENDVADISVTMLETHSASAPRRDEPAWETLQFTETVASDAASPPPPPPVPRAAPAGAAPRHSGIPSAYAGYTPSPQRRSTRQASSAAGDDGPRVGERLVGVYASVLFVIGLIACVLPFFGYQFRKLAPLGWWGGPLMIGLSAFITVVGLVRRALGVHKSRTRQVLFAVGLVVFSIVLVFVIILISVIYQHSQQ